MRGVLYRKAAYHLVEEPTPRFRADPASHQLWEVALRSGLTFFFPPSSEKMGIVAQNHCHSVPYKQRMV